MPDSGIADGTVLTSSFWDTYVRNQTIVTCTSGTRPSGTDGRYCHETDTDRLKWYNGGSGAWETALQLGSSSRIGGTWTRVATQSITTSVNTDILWDTEVYDSDGSLTPTASTFTCQTAVPGLYIASAKIVWSADPSISRLSAIWTLGGTTYWDFTELGSTVAPTGFQQGISSFGVMAAGDTLKIEARQATGAARTLTGRFDVYRIAG